MARQVKVSSGILNISLHPHSEDIYRSFIMDLYRLKQPVRLRGERYGIISLIHNEATEDGYVSGVITTYTRVEIDGSWFDVENLSEATDSQISQINIPDNLFPNSSAFYFKFDLQKHRLYFQNYADGNVLSVNFAMRLFSTLSENRKIREKYGTPKVSLVQTSLGLDKLFQIPIIKRVIITINRPNPDVFDDDFESEIEEELEKANSKKVVIAFEAESGLSLKPTRSIRAASKAALDNGKVEVSGRDESGRVERSTEKFPRLLQAKYDPDLMSDDQAFSDLVRQARRG